MLYWLVGETATGRARGGEGGVVLGMVLVLEEGEEQV